MALKLGTTAGNSPPDMPPPQKSQFAAKVAGQTSSKPKPLVKRGSDDEGNWVKILAYGHSGTGKTLAVLGFLKAGLRVVVISTDLGGNGLASVFNAAKEQGIEHLLDNLVHIDFPDYDTLNDFLKNPTSMWDGFFEFDPDMLVWDGFSGFQQIHVSEKIMDMTPQTKNSSEGREEGLWMEQQDWGMVRNATLRSLGNYLKLHNWEKKKAIHKYMTCLEKKAEADKLTGDVQRAPYLQGSAAALMAPAFDIILETRVKTDPSEKTRNYEYWCVGHEKLLAKSRGFDLSPVEKADMQNLWENKISPKLKRKTT